MNLLPNILTAAVQLALQRGHLPSALGSAELQALFTAMMRRRTLVLARVTKAEFVAEVKRGIARVLQGGTNNSKAEVIGGLHLLLSRLGYSPETGFPGDEALGIPPAEPGSLQDLSSFARLNLIIDTERELAAGLQAKLSGESVVAKALFPAYELIRVLPRDVPRGSIDSGSPGWGERWVKFGGPELVNDGGRTRMIAMKGDDIWRKLGDQALLEDHGINDLALGVDFPPFCIRSGMGWQAIHRSEVKRLGIAPTSVNPANPVILSTSIQSMATPPVNLSRVDAGTEDATLKKLRAAQAKLEAFLAR